MDIESTEVAVVGAGPTGLALALAVDLAARGVDAVVLERAGTLFPGSRGKGIQPRTMEVLDDLGVLDAIRTAGGPYPVGMIWQDGHRTGEHRMFEPAEASEDAPYNEPWMVPQWRTQEILHARLAELGGRVAFGREVVGLEQHPAGVIAHLASGAPVRARYVVAADGGRSAVRRAIGIGMTGEAVDPNPTLVADVRVGGLDRDNWHIFPPGADGEGSSPSARWQAPRTSNSSRGFRRARRPTCPSTASARSWPPDPISPPRTSPRCAGPRTSGRGRPSRTGSARAGLPRR